MRTCCRSFPVKGWKQLLETYDELLQAHGELRRAVCVAEEAVSPALLCLLHGHSHVCVCVPRQNTSDQDPPTHRAFPKGHSARHMHSLGLN